MACFAMFTGRRLLASVAIADLLMVGLAFGAAPPEDQATAAAPAAAPAAELRAPAPPPPPDPAIADLKRQMNALKEEVQTQRALLETTGGDQEAAAKEAPLRIYGWMDAGLNKTWVGNQNVLGFLVGTKAANFAVGNINLYFDFQPFERWSSLVEVRFTNLPDGSVTFLSNPPSLLNTTVFDYGAPLPWSFATLGGLILERAYIQYRHNDLLQVRVGQFLTPFGIWNVDHGTPTLIALALPVFMVQLLFPPAQMGVEALGDSPVGDWDFGYMAYISNGRMPHQVDQTNDKTFGGRLYARTSRPWRLQLGVSGLTGRFSDKAIAVTSVKPVIFSETEITAYREVDLGADLSLDIGHLRVRSEFSRGQYVYEEGKRPADNYGPLGSKVANNVMMDWYLLAAYRLPWLNLEPYLYYEYFQWRTGLGAGYMAVSGGLNVYFTPAAQLRLQYIDDVFFEDLSNFKRSAPQDNKLFIARIVLGF